MEQRCPRESDTELPGENPLPPATGKRTMMEYQGPVRLNPANEVKLGASVEGRQPKDKVGEKAASCLRCLLKGKGNKGDRPGLSLFSMLFPKLLSFGEKSRTFISILSWSLMTSRAQFLTSELNRECLHGELCILGGGRYQ